VQLLFLLGVFHAAPHPIDCLDEANSAAAASAATMLLKFLELPTGTSVVTVTFFFPVN